MGSFEVIGGRKLSGEIIPQGAKNEALQVICAVLLTEEPVTITNIPDIIDINKLIELPQGDASTLFDSSANTKQPMSYPQPQQNQNNKFKKNNYQNNRQKNKN